MKKLLLLIVFFTAVWIIYAKFWPKSEPRSIQSHKGIVISHKTAGLEYPENSLKGFKASLDMDVDAIEIDVHVIKDKAVVLHHDPVLSDFNCFPKKDKTKLIIAQQTAEDLQALKCHNHKVDKPYQIITLDQFLSIYRTSDMSKQILLEIKVWDELIENNPIHEDLDVSQMHYPNQEVADAVYAVLRKYPEVQNIQFNTFSRELLLLLRDMKQPEETFEFGLLYKGHYAPIVMAPLALLTGNKCYDFCWAPDYEEVRAWLDTHKIGTFIPNFPQAMSFIFHNGFLEHIMDKKADLKVIPWTPNEPKDWAKYETQGFDGILTDKPTKFHEWVNAEAAE